MPKRSLTYSLHCSSFWGLPFRLLNTKMVKPQKGTTMETVGKPEVQSSSSQAPGHDNSLAGQSQARLGGGGELYRGCLGVV